MKIQNHPIRNNQKAQLSKCRMKLPFVTNQNMISQTSSVSILREKTKANYPLLFLKS